MMPYEKLKDLPESVRDNLPKHAQEIYQEAFNSAWDQYKDPEDRRGDATREETAHRVAWAAVKKVYEKDEDSGKWMKK
jgi:cation transport regulator